jgi:hypothetical protein
MRLVQDAFLWVTGQLDSIDAHASHLAYTLEPGNEAFDLLIGPHKPSFVTFDLEATYSDGGGLCRPDTRFIDNT